MGCGKKLHSFTANGLQPAQVQHATPFLETSRHIKRFRPRQATVQLCLWGCVVPDEVQTVCGCHSWQCMKLVVASGVKACGIVKS